MLQVQRVPVLPSQPHPGDSQDSLSLTAILAPLVETLTWPVVEDQVLHILVLPVKPQRRVSIGRALLRLPKYCFLWIVNVQRVLVSQM